VAVAFSVLDLEPPSVISSPTGTATLNVPWSGTVATFADDPSFSGSDVSANVSYGPGGGGPDSGQVSASGGGVWTVSDSQTFTGAGSVSVQTTITDAAGQQATANGYINVSLAPYSVSAVSPTLTEGQAQDVTVGMLSDAAGTYSVPSEFSGTYTIEGQTTPVALVPSGLNDGNYTLTTNLPGLGANPGAGTLDVGEAGGGASNDVSTGGGSPPTVTPYNTLSVSSQDASIQAGQTGPIDVGSVSDSLQSIGATHSSSYSGTLSVGGQAIAVSFNGSEVQADLSSINPGTYTGDLSVTSRT
jgi:hypothetical protein